VPRSHVQSAPQQQKKALSFFFNGDQMHRSEFVAAFARHLGNGNADIVNFTFIGSHDHSRRNNQYCYDELQNDATFLL